MREINVAIIGSGLTGIALYKNLQKLNPIVLEKSRGIGGRIATRRMGSSYVNHGVESFEAVHPTLMTYLTSQGSSFFSIDQQVATPVGNINSWFKELCSGITVLKEHELKKIEFKSSKQILHFKNENQTFEVKNTILAIPAPQAKFILEQSQLDGSFLEKVNYESSVQFFCLIKKKIDDSKLETETYLLKKILKTEEAFLYHFEIKQEHINEFLQLDKEEIIKFFMNDLKLTHEDLLETHAHKWRYSRALSTLDPHFQLKYQNYGLYLAGDYFFGNDLNSSIKSAEYIEEHFPITP